MRAMYRSPPRDLAFVVPNPCRRRFSQPVSHHRAQARFRRSFAPPYYSLTAAQRILKGTNSDRRGRKSVKSSVYYNASTVTGNATEKYRKAGSKCRRKDRQREHAACCRQMSGRRSMMRMARNSPMARGLRAGRSTARGGVGQEGRSLLSGMKMSASVERRRARSLTSLSEHRKTTRSIQGAAQPSPQTNRNLSEKTATNATRTARGESQGRWSHTPPRLAG